MILRRWLYTLFSLLLALALVTGGWYGLKWLQLSRADSMVAAANSHMETANQLMAEAPLGSMGRDAFTSTDSISQGSAAAQAALPLLGQARGEVEQALAEVRRARGLFLLPEGYYDYLRVKEQSALARIEQLDNLEQTINQLQELYASGQLIFTSVEELDRLLGQYYAAQGLMLSSPADARAGMEQVSASLRALKAQLDTAYAEKGFQLLADLSAGIEANAQLVDLSAQLADATAAGDQARAQQAALLVDQKLADRNLGFDHLDLWWRVRINPLRRDFDDLQARQESLDAEAAAAHAAAEE